MTDIKAVLKDNHFCLDMTGHAGGTEYCAAVSTLLYTLYNRLGELSQEGELKTKDGEAHLYAEVTPTSLPVIETILTGFRALSLFYPEHIRFNLYGG